ncbi:hypothetical protein ACHAPQ_011668 [Fusarium lateritium]
MSMNYSLFSGVPDQPDLPADPSSKPFTLAAVAGPDVWRTPTCAGGRDDFNGPIYATSLTLNSFKSAKVTISGDFKTAYSQGGLILFMPDCPAADIAGKKTLNKSPDTWIKAGIERVDGQLFASVAAGKPYSDWSLVKLDQGRATFEMEKSKGSLWIYVTGPDGQRTPVRKLTWVFDTQRKEDIWVGVTACMPKGDGSENSGSLKVQFSDLSIKTE